MAAPTTTTQPNDQGASTAEQKAGDPNASSNVGPSTSPNYYQNPLGVPYWELDPLTGQPVTNAAGAQKRWQVPVTIPGYRDPDKIAGPGGGMGHTAAVSGYQLPVFYEGSQYLPASMAPDKIATLQRGLIQAGVLKQGAARLGIWDQASVDAYQQILEYANRSGITDPMQALAQWGPANQQSLKDQAAGMPVHVSSATDLQTVFRKAVIDTLGQGWDQAKIDQMVHAYQGIETSAGQQANLASVTGQGGTIEAPPNAAAYAEQQARQQNPIGAQEHDVIAPGGPLDAFRSMLKGWA